MTEQLILVDEHDTEVGTAGKIEVHQQGLLHRAFSVFIFRGDELLLQRRHDDKYHCGGLWTNSCCGHPRPGETLIAAAERRLFEEMGFQLTLKAVGRFHYTAHFDNGLTENELDHVCVGEFNQQTINPHPEEIAEYRWAAINDIAADLTTHPSSYTPWFQQALEIATKR